MPHVFVKREAASYECYDNKRFFLQQTKKKMKRNEEEKTQKRKIEAAAAKKKQKKLCGCVWKEMLLIARFYTK